MNQIIAIDPGASGGIAWMDEDGFAQAAPMPKTHSDIIETIVGKSFGNVTFVIEDLPKHCGIPRPASSTFVMAYNYGLICGAILALRKPLHRVRPQVWQAGVGSTKKTQGSGWKRWLAGIAQERFPHLKVTQKTADALLILDYARRTLK